MCANEVDTPDKNISKITDVDGNVMKFTYSGGQLQIVTDQVGRTLTLEYDTSNRIHKVTDSTKRFVIYDYTADELKTYTDPESKEWKYDYLDHKMTTLTNPLSVVTATNAYDDLGRVKTQTVPRQNPVGVPATTKTTATYNFYFPGDKNVEENPSGQRLTYYYDAKGREYAQTNALGFGSKKVFDGQDHLVQLTDPRGKITGIFKYDGNHNLTNESNDLSFGSREAYSYTNTFDPTDFTLTDIVDHYSTHKTHNDYAKYHLTSTKDAVNDVFQATFKGRFGLQDTATDGKSYVTTTTYDDFGNPKTSKTEAHPEITYTYDQIGRLTDLKDQYSSITSFEYDKRGLRKKITDPNPVYTTVFEYHDDGKLWKKTDRNGNLITYDYTPSRKIEQISYLDSTTVFYKYNLLDQLESMTDSIGTTKYHYDVTGRIKSISNPYTTLSNQYGFTVSYDYDESGNVTQLTYPGPDDTKKVIYEYDAQNRLTKVTPNWLADGTTAKYTYKEYEQGFLPDVVTNIDGISTKYTYDDAHRLTNLVINSSTQYNMILDPNGNRETIDRLNEPLTTADKGFAPITNVYSDLKNRLSSDGVNSFGYDFEGQLNSGYGSNYTFDYEHQLTGISHVAQYTYDGAGNRLKAVRNGVETRYIYDAAGRLLAEADSTDTITRYYIYGAGLLAVVLPDGTFYGYQSDPNGNVVAVGDQNAYAYDPYGAVIDQRETFPQPFKFAGQFGVMAEPNGLYYMKARYYDSKVGRFISEDPSGFAGGDVNLSAYVRSNPINSVDPSGLREQSSSYTSSSLQKGQQMHSAYRIDEVVPDVAMKEFRLDSGKRLDFIDLSSQTIYELKPNNPRGLAAGLKQLKIYIQDAEAQFGTTGWKGVLDLY